MKQEKKSIGKRIKRAAVSLTLATATLGGGSVVVHAQEEPVQTTSVQAQEVATTNNVSTTNAEVAQQPTSKNISSGTPSVSNTVGDTSSHVSNNARSAKTNNFHGTTGTPSQAGKDASITQSTAEKTKNINNTVAVNSASSQTAQANDAIVNTTKQDYDSLKKNYDDTSKSYQDSQSKTVQAKEESNQAKAKAEKAKNDLETAAKEVTQKKADYTQAQNEVNRAGKAVTDAKAKQSDANQALEDAKTAYQKAQEKTLNAQQALTKAKDNYTKAETALEDAKANHKGTEQTESNLAAAKQAQKAAQEKADQAQAKEESTKTKMDQANADKDKADSELADAQVAKDKADAAVKDAQDALDKANQNVENSGKTFIESGLADPTGQAFDVYVKELENDANVGKYAKDKAFSESLKSAQEIKNIREDIQLIKECNELRAKHGLQPLKINFSAMEIAMLSASLSNSAAINDHQFDHYLWLHSDLPGNSKSAIESPYSAGNRWVGGRENIAWGYDDPYDGWYTEEKVMNDAIQIVQKEGFDEKGQTDFKAFLKSNGYSDSYIDNLVKDMKSFNNGQGVNAKNIRTYVMLTGNLQDGHYLNVLHQGSTFTGLAITSHGGCAAQEFCAPSSYETSSNKFGKIYTVDEFSKLLDDFVAKNSTEVAKAQKALEAAKDAQTKVSNALTDKQNAADKASEAVKSAQAEYEKAKADNADAQKALKEAIANTQAADRANEDAKSKDATYAETIAQKEADLKTAQDAQTQAQTALANAKADEAKAKDARDAAQADKDKADQNVENAASALADKQKAVDTFKSAVDQALANEADAQKASSDADADYAKAIDAFKNAKGLEKEAYDAYQKSGDALIKFVNDHLNALPSADQITLKDKDEVDTLSKIVNAVPSELKDNLDSDALSKLNSAKQKIADLTLAEKDKETAKAVADQIKALPDQITADNAKDIYDAQKAYDGLTDRQKDYIGQDVKEKIKNAVTLADAATAREVNDAIKKLPDSITLNDKAQVENIRKMYNQLSDGAKAQVNTAKLEKAEKAIRDLEKQKKDYEEAKKVDVMIHALPKRPTIKNRAGVLQIYKRYQALSKNARSLLSHNDINRMQNAVKMVGGESVSPKTGDTTSTEGAMAALLAAGATAGVAFAVKRRQHDNA